MRIAARNNKTGQTTFVGSVGFIRGILPGVSSNIEKFEAAVKQAKETGQAEFNHYTLYNV